MKKVGLTVRIPIFIEVECEMSDTDFENLLDGWDSSNFGIVKQIVNKYAEVDELNINEDIDRRGSSEVVDIKLFEDIKDEVEDDEVQINTSSPKGKLN